MRTTIQFVCAALIVAASTTPVLAQAPQKISTIEGITEYRLENGLQLLLFPDESLSTVTVNMTVLVGSRHEGYGETGMAHLLEHMLFKDSTNHKDLPKLLKDRGATFNGTTWVDRTNYFETLNATDDNLEFAIKMEADRLVNAMIRAEDLASEMTVVRNEFERGENSPQRILMQRINAAAFEWHNYGKSTIGNRSDIERVPVYRLRRFYEKFYQPDNVMLVIAGRFDKQNALDLVHRHFGAIPKPERELERPYTEEPAQDGERIAVLRRVGDVALVGLGYHIPAAGHPEYAAVEVLSNILGMQPGGRLYEKLVKSKKATNVFSMSFASHDPGLLLAGGEVPKSQSIETLRDELIETVEGVAVDGVSEQDVKRAREKLLKSREDLFANSTRLAVNLSEWGAYGDWRLFFLHRDRLESVTAEKVQDVARKYLRQSNRTVGMFIPTEEPTRVAIPNTPNLKKMVADIKSRKAVATGEKFEPTPENIEQRTIRGTLADGVKYAFLPKKTRGEKIFVNLSLHYGSAESLQGKAFAAQMLPSLMNRGTNDMSYQELKDKLDELRTSISIGGSAGKLTATVSTKRENLVESIHLLKQVLRSPKLDESELEILREQSLSQLESSKSEPQMLAFTAFQRKISPYPAGDVRYAPTIEESIEMTKAVTAAQIRELYEEFVSGQHAELAVVGDFQPEEIESQLSEIFDGWTSASEYERIETRADTEMKGERININTPDKANAVFVAGITGDQTDTDPEYEATVIGNYILGGGPLSSRLADRVRKKDGLSYGVGSRFIADDQDPVSMLMAFAISNPANTEKVVDAIDDEMTRMRDSGVSGEELEKAKDSFNQVRQRGRSNDQRLAGTLRSHLELGRTMEFELDREDVIASLTKQEVDQAIAAALDLSRIIVVTAGDFDAASESTSTDDQDDSGDGENQ